MARVCPTVSPMLITMDSKVNEHTQCGSAAELSNEDFARCTEKDCHFVVAEAMHRFNLVQSLPLYHVNRSADHFADVSLLAH